MPIELEWDEPKRSLTLANRGLDFADAALVFDQPVLTLVDDRLDYGEVRMITRGVLKAVVVVIVWTRRGERRRIISMRRANDNEDAEYRAGVG